MTVSKGLMHVNTWKTSECKCINFSVGDDGNGNVVHHNSTIFTKYNLFQVSPDEVQIHKINHQQQCE